MFSRCKKTLLDCARLISRVVVMQEVAVEVVFVAVVVVWNLLEAR